LIFDSADFTFKPPEALSRARRIVIKPCAGTSAPYPANTSREMLHQVIAGIRRLSDADIVLLEGTASGAPIAPVFKALGYDFPRLLTLDVNDTTWVEVDNPLLKPLVMATFWVPNIILSSDYLISVTPLKVVGGTGLLSIANLLSLLPVSKYGQAGWESLYALGISKVLSDLYFTLPFDMGIIDARQKFTSQSDKSKGQIENVGKVFMGEPFEVDAEVSRTLGANVDYLELIKTSSVELERWS